MEDDMFARFVEDLNQNLKLKSALWDKNRNKYVKDNVNKRKNILTELSFYNYNNPLLTIHPNYILEDYAPVLLSREVSHIAISDFISEETRGKLFEKCENIERVKKILDFYLTFVIEKNFDYLITSMKKLKFFENGIEGGLKITRSLSEKVHIVKKRNIRNSSQILLCKQKMKNMVEILKIMKLKIFKCYSNYLEARVLKKKNKYSALFYKIKEILADIEESENILGKKKFNIFSILRDKCNKKMFKLTNTCQTHFTNLFITRKENIFEELYLFYLSQGNYISRIRLVLTHNIFHVIKETLISFADEQVRKDTITEPAHLAKVKFDKCNFIKGLNQVYRNSASIIENFWYYIQLHKTMKLAHPKAQELNNEIVEYFANPETDGGRRQFFEIAEQKFSELLGSFEGLINELSFTNLMYFSLYSSLFLDYLLCSFEVDYSNYLKPVIQELVSKNLVYNTTVWIIKQSKFLEQESWKRIPLNDNYNFFSSQIIQQMYAPLYVKDYMNAFNTTQLVSPEDIKKSLYQQLDKFQFGKFMSFIDVGPDIMVLSKPINYSNLMIGTSADNLMKNLLNLIAYLCFYDNMCFMVFEQIFNIYNYYIFASIFMYVEPKLIDLLFDDLDVETELKKTDQKNRQSTIEILSWVIFYRYKHKETIRLLKDTKAKLEELFNKKIDISRKNESYGANQFYIPYSKVVQNGQNNNSYMLLNERVILCESIHSIYKILKKIIHFKSKLEYPFQASEIERTILGYKPLIKELRKLFYYPVLDDIMRYKSNNNKIESMNWNIQMDNQMDMTLEGNPYVNNVFQEICSKYESLDSTSGGSFSEKSKKRFLEVVLIYTKESMIESFSRIKKCSFEGRSLMLKDVKFLKSKLEGKYKIDINAIFNELVLYVTSWYSGENDLLKYIEENKVGFKHILGLLDTGDQFINLERIKRLELMSKIEKCYIELLINLSIELK